MEYFQLCFPFQNLEELSNEKTSVNGPTIWTNSQEVLHVYNRPFCLEQWVPFQRQCGVR